MSQKSKSQGTSPKTQDLEKRARLHQFRHSSGYSYEVECDWIPVSTEDKTRGEIFFTAYRKTEQKSRKALNLRPLCFVFNGGPGASSAYLHIGALGPKRIPFEKQGQLPKPPARLEDNSESWLDFSDLVFVDPVETGWSRVIGDKPEGSNEKAGPPASELEADSKSEAKKADEKTSFFEVTKDLESLRDFIIQYLSRAKRWSSPILIAGESYGGFRVAKLSRLLQEEAGIQLYGVALISPALEFSHLSSNDYSLDQFVNSLPSFAATAHHWKMSKPPAKQALHKFLEQVEAFACKDFAELLLAGDALSRDQQKSRYQQLSRWLGLKEAYLEKKAGRIQHRSFVRELFRDHQKVLGLYDASVPTLDPFPDRDSYEGPDPTLFSIDGVFGSCINQLLREDYDLQTDRSYYLINMKVRRSWQFQKSGALSESLSASDDLRYAMSLNPHMKVWFTHGLFDLVTPYFSSKRIIQLIGQKSPETRERIRQDDYLGGHMFYSWDASRVQFFKDAKTFFSLKGA